jgi:hypothetical protein
VLVSLQLLLGRYAGSEAEFWKWFLPNILPLTALLAAGIITDQRLPAADDEPVDTTSFRLALLLCYVYLGLLLASILIASIRAADPMPTLENANWFLGFLQALVTGVLGVYFTKLRTLPPTGDNKSTEGTL